VEKGNKTLIGYFLLILFLSLLNLALGSPQALNKNVAHILSIVCSKEVKNINDAEIHVSLINFLTKRTEITLILVTVMDLHEEKYTIIAVALEKSIAEEIKYTYYDTTLHLFYKENEHIKVDEININNLTKIQTLSTSKYYLLSIVVNNTSVLRKTLSKYEEIYCIKLLVSLRFSCKINTMKYIKTLGNNLRELYLQPLTSMSENIVVHIGNEIIKLSSAKISTYGLLIFLPSAVNIVEVSPKPDEISQGVVKSIDYDKLSESCLIKIKFAWINPGELFTVVSNLLSLITVICYVCIIVVSFIHKQRFLKEQENTVKKYLVQVNIKYIIKSHGFLYVACIVTGIVLAVSYVLVYSISGLPEDFLKSIFSLLLIDFIWIITIVSIIILGLDVIHNYVENSFTVTKSNYIVSCCTALNVLFLPLLIVNTLTLSVINSNIFLNTLYAICLAFYYISMMLLEAVVKASIHEDKLFSTIRIFLIFIKYSPLIMLLGVPLVYYVEIEAYWLLLNNILFNVNIYLCIVSLLNILLLTVLFNKKALTSYALEIKKAKEEHIHVI